MDAFYHGLSVPIFNPAYLLLLVSAGLYLGQRSTGHNLKLSLLLFGTLLLSLLLGLRLGWGGMPGVLLTPALLLGLLTAGSVALPGMAQMLLVALCGAALGGSLAGEARNGLEIPAILGSLVGMAVLFYYPMLLAEWLRKREWQRIGVRILGSWLAASALLTLAFIIRSNTAT
ncbi:MAG: HupE/UreJ family protein [Candidatus Thiodiazotropha sp.]